MRSASSGRVRTTSLRTAPSTPAVSRSDSPQKLTVNVSSPAVTRLTRTAGPASPTKRSMLAPAATVPAKTTLTRSRTATSDSVQSASAAKPRPARVESPSAISPSTSQRTSSPPPIPAPNFTESQPARPPSTLLKELVRLYAIALVTLTDIYKPIEGRIRT